MIHQSLCGPWQFRQVDGRDWQPASVPGGVHTDLLALGQIPDPFSGDNEKQVQWVADADWEYRRTFIVDPHLAGRQHKYLVCDGLDTLAAVTLNGQMLGQTDNMFRRWRWDVTSLLRPGENEIHVRFQSPLGFTRPRQAAKPLTGGGDLPGGPHLRKAPYQWGWDWGPKLPPIGIWKDIRLEGCTRANLKEVRIHQEHKHDRVALDIRAVLDGWETGADTLRVVLKAPDGETVQMSIPANGEMVDLQIEVPNPQLWWPNGYGPQPLYRLEVVLQADEKELDRQSYQIGLRTLALQRQPDAWGESFTFIVNDVPIFAKGANWIPADSFPARIQPERLEHLIHSAVGAHMNMLRVWGGGLYEDDLFYDLCDRCGILIWQDFMFACGIYPEDDDFAENVRIEAVQQVQRLRHHACLALWCGNNEMEQGWVDWGWNQPEDLANQRLKAGYDRMFHHLLPDVVAAEDPDRAYWPSSASSGIPFAEPNGQQRGDTHYWDVWHGRKPFSAYQTQFPRFMSEFGFQSLPPFATIQSYAKAEEQNLTSYIMEHHQRSGNGNSLILSQLADHFRIPKDFPALVYLSMVLQAEGIRCGVEHWRRSRQRVSGTLYWQLNDCWPVASWSSLDYFGRWKALHYAARRFYAPLLLSVDEKGREMEVHLTSDLTNSWKGTLHWRLERLDGQIIERGEMDVRAEPLADTRICTLDFSHQITDAVCRETVLVCELWQEDERIAWCVIRFAVDKHLKLVNPGLETQIRLDGDTLLIDVAARSLALFVELALQGVDTVFSDNYFDLPAGMNIQITAPLPDGWTLAQAQRALRVRSLVDSCA